MRKLIAFVAVYSALLMPNLALSVEESHPDKVIAKKQIAGRLILFEEGDYVHVTLKPTVGKEVSFFLGNEGCFLARHYDQTLDVEYNEVERYFEEGGGYFPANLIQSITEEKTKAKWNAADSKPANPDDELACLNVLDEKLGQHTAD